MYRLQNKVVANTRSYKVTSNFFNNNNIKETITRSDKELPRPKSWPIVGTKLSILRSGGASKIHNYVDRRHTELGPLFCENLGGKDVIFISDSKLMKTLFLNLEGKYPAHFLPEAWVLYEKLYGSRRGLFFMEGEEWLRNRRAVNRHLMREDSERWLEGPVKITIAKYIEKLKQNIKNGNQTLNLEADLYNLSTTVVISILLGSESSMQESRQYQELLNQFSKHVKDIFHNTTKLFPLPAEWYQKLNMKAWNDFKDSVDMSLFLANKLAKEMLQRKDINTGLIKKMCDENIPEEMITRIVADFVIAAGDTTSYTTLWTLYLLSQNEAVCKELRERKEGNYVKNVVKESLRLYPIAPFLTRVLPKDSNLGSYNLKAGTQIAASIYTSGRLEENFSKPEEFLPYRWDKTDERRKLLTNHEPSGSLPFAMGARSCVGKKIATIQLSEIINQIVQNFDFKLSNTSKVNAVMSQVLVPDKPLDLIFSLRQQ